MIGKFGAESKLSNTITIEPESTTNAANNNGIMANDLNDDFRKLLEYCINENIPNIDNDNVDNSLENIVRQTSDLYFHFENDLTFCVHKVIVKGLFDNSISCSLSFYFFVLGVCSRTLRIF